jgi:hypothetical protein
VLGGRGGRLTVQDTVLLPVTAYRGAVTAESLLATMQFVRDSGGTVDSIYAGTFLTGGWWKNGDTAKVDTSQTWPNAALLQTKDTTFLWPHAALADSAVVAANAHTLQGKDTTFKWPASALADSTVNVADSLTGTAADFLRHYGQLRCGTTPVVTGTGAMVGGGASDTASGAYSTVAGGFANKASGDSSFVGGGVRNKATGHNATIAGGQGNTASNWSFIGGGDANVATTQRCVVVGGRGNTAAGYDNATIVGGWNNVAYGGFSFIGTGRNHIARGAYTIIPGGEANLDSGHYSFALGCSLRVQATDSLSGIIGHGAGAGLLATTGKRQVMIGVRQPNTVFWEDDSVVEQAYVKHISHGHARFDSTVAICSTAVRSGYELFVKGDAAISGAVMLGAAVIDSITYAADTSAMYIWTRGKKGTVTLTAP